MPHIPVSVDDYVARLVAAAQPLSPDQLDRLTVLLGDRQPLHPNDLRRDLDFREEQAGRLRRQAAARRLPVLADGRRDPASVT